MTFGNFKFIIYIITPALLAAAVFAGYIIWKRHLLKNAGASMMLVNKKAGVVKNILIFLSLVLFSITLLRPQWGDLMRDVRNEGSDVLVMLDVSRSMLAKDVSPDRLQRSKDAIKWIAGSLKGDRIGLILFAGDAFLQCPLTNDIGAFMMFLDSASPESVRLQGTDFGRAFSEAYRVFRKKRLTSRILVIVTDGEDNEGSAMQAVSMFKELDVSVYSVGIGTERGDSVPDNSQDAGNTYLKDSSGKIVSSRKNTGLLKKLAGATGGHYIDITESFSGLKFILEIIGDQQRNDYGNRIIKERMERYQIFALVLMLLMSIEIMLPHRRRLK